jgi:hypothetical protein
MNLNYRPDDYEIKLMILYAVKKLRRSPTYAILSQILTECADINYFEIPLQCSE